MSEISTYNVIQNVALSALALHSFARGYQSITQKKNVNHLHAKLDYYFFVLPLVYHSDSLYNFYRRNNLYTVFKDYPEIITQLQHRANKMSEQTFDALNLAFNKGLLNLIYTDSAKYYVTLQRKSAVIAKQDNQVDKILIGSRKLGFMFAKETDLNLQIKLNVTF